ncbi:hypothetical protein BC826DRAFT_143899 [Russula brevipes]|nr:hypothetical protein BC826DRAFT_143899 [Russula brevipes]
MTVGRTYETPPTRRRPTTFRRSSETKQLFHSAVLCGLFTFIRKQHSDLPGKRNTYEPLPVPCVQLVWPSSERRKGCLLVTRRISERQLIFHGARYGVRVIRRSRVVRSSLRRPSIDTVESVFYPHRMLSFLKREPYRKLLYSAHIQSSQHLVHPSPHTARPRFRFHGFGNLCPATLSCFMGLFPCLAF